jgi:hypothetical protein
VRQQRQRAQARRRNSATWRANQVEQCWRVCWVKSRNIPKSLSLASSWRSTRCVRRRAAKSMRCWNCLHMIDMNITLVRINSCVHCFCLHFSTFFFFFFFFFFDSAKGVVANTHSSAREKTETTYRRLYGRQGTFHPSQKSNTHAGFSRRHNFVLRRAASRDRNCGCARIGKSHHFMHLRRRTFRQSAAFFCALCVWFVRSNAFQHICSWIRRNKHLWCVVARAAMFGRLNWNLCSRLCTFENGGLQFSLTSL